MAMLAACYAVDVILKLGSISFPPSVACLILLFLGLLASEWLLGQSKTRRLVALIDVPVSLDEFLILDITNPSFDIGRMGSSMD
jgi:hypothetical protein